jgi:hypothetical protein
VLGEGRKPSTMDGDRVNRRAEGFPVPAQCMQKRKTWSRDESPRASKTTRRSEEERAIASGSSRTRRPDLRPVSSSVSPRWTLWATQDQATCQSSIGNRKMWLCSHSAFVSGTPVPLRPVRQLHCVQCGALFNNDLRLGPSTYPERSLSARPFVLHLSSRESWRDLRIAGSLRSVAESHGQCSMINHQRMRWWVATNDPICCPRQ